MKGAKGYVAGRSPVKSKRAIAKIHAEIDTLKLLGSLKYTMVITTKN